MRGPLIWAVVALGMLLPIALAASSPWLAGRGADYIIGGFAGIVALVLLLVQPMLAANWLPGLRGRWLHRWVGGAVVVAVLLHVGGLYLASPEDAMDALLLVSPTPFSVYGVAAMWAVFLTAVLALVRGRIGPQRWRLVHGALALGIVAATAGHALQIEGTMEHWSKLALSLAAVGMTVAVIARLWLRRLEMRGRNR